ncbi:MAG TPA: hypothetical protein VFK37_02710 [Bacillales bacterium]|nr:hypothetical protein [Bacillales bacterium]
MKNTQVELSELIASLKKWDGRDLLISKQENGDRDQTVLKLENIEIKERGQSIDGYVSDASLQLKGQGRALLEDTEVPMPSASYDIPIDALYDAHFDGMRFYMSTDRGSYTISPI